jgi:hypothetical protein
MLRCSQSPNDSNIYFVQNCLLLVNSARSRAGHSLAPEATKKASGDETTTASKAAAKDGSKDKAGHSGVKHSHPEDDGPRAKALTQVLKEIESSYGKGSMIRLGTHW